MGWLRHDDAVVPKELIYPPDQTDQQVEQKNADDFANSESSAQTAAFAELGYPGQITVKRSRPGFPGPRQAAGGRASLAQRRRKRDPRRPSNCRARCRSSRPGRRSPSASPGPVRRARCRSRPRPAATRIPRIGVSTSVVSTAPFKVNFPIQDIGGPSAGLMLTLGIIDKIKAEDLTGGKIIAGTGTIDGQWKCRTYWWRPQEARRVQGRRCDLLPDPEGQLRRGGAGRRSTVCRWCRSGRWTMTGSQGAGRHPGRHHAGALPGREECAGPRSVERKNLSAG